MTPPVTDEDDMGYVLSTLSVRHLLMHLFKGQP